MKKSIIFSIKSGFTIVELLVVIVVIGILASITVNAYSGIQRRAQISKINTDLKTFSKAIQLARLNESKTLIQITGYNYSAGACFAKATGTDLAALPRSDSCWVRYFTVLDTVSAASSINIRNLVDPWGRPYAVDENEGESGGCSRDSIRTFSEPFVTNMSLSGPNTELIPISGFTGCS